MITDAQVTQAFEQAFADVENHIRQRRAEAEQAQSKWNRKSHERYLENGLNQQLGRHSGRLDDTYMAEVPLTLGWNHYEDGTSLAFVSLGGVDVSAYLPPDVMADIQSHILSKWEDEA